MRAAEAAKNTSDLISGVIQKIDDGSNLVSESTQSFEEVYDRSAKIASITAEVKDAIGEQTQGINQINLAINDMDQRTQQNAATAEESASLALSITSDAEKLMSIVSQLTVPIHLNGQRFFDRQVHGYRQGWRFHLFELNSRR